MKAQAYNQQRLEQAKFYRGRTGKRDWSFKPKGQQPSKVHTLSPQEIKELYHD